MFEMPAVNYHDVVGPGPAAGSLGARWPRYKPGLFVTHSHWQGIVARGLVLQVSSLAGI